MKRFIVSALLATGASLAAHVITTAMVGHPYSSLCWAIGLVGFVYMYWKFPELY